MANPEDEKNEQPRFGSDEVPTSDGLSEPTTPYGTPVPSQPAGEPYLTDRALRDIALRFDLLGELGRGPVLLAVPFLLWALVFMGVGAIYLQPQLATTYRLVNAVFE